MASLLPVIAIAQILMFGLALALPERKLDCSGVIMSSTLQNYGDICVGPDEWAAKSARMSMMEKLDRIETCTCDLLRHKIAFESMMTHEVDTMFHSSRKLVADLKKDPKRLDDTGIPTSILMETDEDDHMFFWDRFSALLRDTNPNQGAELSTAFFAIFADGYYNPDSYSMPFKGTPQSMNLRRTIQTSCNTLLGQSGDFLKHLNNLRQMSENPRYIYRMVSYDENLYKIVSVIKICQYLSLARNFMSY